MRDANPNMKIIVSSICLASCLTITRCIWAMFFRLLRSFLAPLVLYQSIKGSEWRYTRLATSLNTTQSPIWVVDQTRDEFYDLETRASKHIWRYQMAAIWYPAIGKCAEAHWIKCHDYACRGKSSLYHEELGQEAWTGMSFVSLRITKLDLGTVHWETDRLWAINFAETIVFNFYVYILFNKRSEFPVLSVCDIFSPC